MPDQFAAGLSYQSTSSACISDTTPPTFAGIATLVPKSNGALRATWLAASDATTPIRYNIYIQAVTATGLFSSANRVLSTEKLTSDIFQDSAGVLLISNSQGGPIYFVGVRAVDAVGNEETNLVSISAASTGVIPDNFNAIANALAATEVLLAADEADFDADLVIFASQLVTLAGQLSHFDGDLSELDAINVSLNNIKNALQLFFTGCDVNLEVQTPLITFELQTLNIDMTLEVEQDLSC